MTQNVNSMAGSESEKSQSAPLVSVIVITYNSAKYVIETLESVKSQTYKNIELIISDDCSTDDTAARCRLWLAENGSDFKNVRLIENSTNLGVPGNCNKGIYAAKGAWVKLLGGDDLLVSNSIQVFVDFLLCNSGVKYLVGSKFEMQGGRISKIVSPSSKYLRKTPMQQLKILLSRHHAHMPAPALFLNKQGIIELGGFDERFRYMEDFPFELKVSNSGYKFIHVNVPVVVHRIHAESLSGDGPSPKLLESINRCHAELVMPMMREQKMWSWHRHYQLKNRLSLSIGYRRALLSYWIRLTDPIYWYGKMLQLFSGKKLIDVDYDIVMISNYRSGRLSKVWSRVESDSKVNSADGM
jgi:glycosyltransferase involved in cell wall biosynthesis